MKKTIQIDIEYPDCDMLNPTELDLIDLEIESRNIFGIYEEVLEGRFSISAKVVEPVNEKELDKLAEEITVGL